MTLTLKSIFDVDFFDFLYIDYIKCIISWHYSFLVLMYVSHSVTQLGWLQCDLKKIYEQYLWAMIVQTSCFLIYVNWRYRHFTWVLQTMLDENASLVSFVYFGTLCRTYRLPENLTTDAHLLWCRSLWPRFYTNNISRVGYVKALHSQEERLSAKSMATLGVLVQ